MMKRILTASAILFSFTCFAQEDSADTKPQLKLSVNYHSGLNYFGRTDSLKSSGFFPMAEFWITPKFYINAAPVFVNNKVQSFEYAGTVTSAGYLNVTDKWISGAYVMKPFYTKTSNLPQSALQAQFGTNFSRLTRVVNFNLGADLKFSDRTDIGASFGLDHLIRIENKDESILIIDPSFYVHGGTQQYSRTFQRKQNTGLPVPGPTQEVTEEVNQFNILSYEASVPLIFVKGKLMILATPSYVVPQNLLKVTNRPDLSEHGSSMFYTTLGIKYSF